MNSACAILDEAHLARQTFGDPALEREVVALFLDQLAGLEQRLAEASAQRRSDLLHGLKGSARAVGAMALAALAEEFESAAAPAPEELARMLAHTRSALAARRRRTSPQGRQEADGPGLLT